METTLEFTGCPLTQFTDMEDCRTNTKKHEDSRYHCSLSKTDLVLCPSHMLTEGLDMSPVDAPEQHA